MTDVIGIDHIYITCLRVDSVADVHSAAKQLRAAAFGRNAGIVTTTGIRAPADTPWSRR